MIGSLNKVWPWKEVLETRTNSHGETVPFLEKSILPQDFNGDAQVLTSILLAFFGFLLIYGMEKIATRIAKN
jgi:putative membrane protein